MIRQIFITLLATSHFYMVKFKLIKRLKLRKKCTSQKEIGVGLTKSATLLTNLIVVSLATRHSSAARYISLKYCKYCNYLWPSHSKILDMPMQGGPMQATRNS